MTDHLKHLLDLEKGASIPAQHKRVYVKKVRPPKQEVKRYDQKPEHEADKWAEEVDRQCLSCGKNFIARGRYIRRCKSCRGGDDYNQEGGSTGRHIGGRD